MAAAVTSVWLGVYRPMRRRAKLIEDRGDSATGETAVYRGRWLAHRLRFQPKTQQRQNRSWVP